MGTSSDNWIASPEAESLDIELAAWDCLATRAHVLMLAKQGIITPPEKEAILVALQEIYEICADGEFRYEPGYGAQLTLEKMIIDRVGPDVGRKVHTGRSRNDQVLTAQKLYVRDKSIQVMKDLLLLIEKLIKLCEEELTTIMPGYTHMQPARPTTVAQWAAAYADMFLRDFQRLSDSYTRNDSCPLGAAESHGTSWDLDRDYTRRLLGFSKVHEIPLDAISSRGESDADFLSSISFISLHISKMAEDLLLFSTYEFDYLSLGSGQATRMGRLTGSSIMPQKRNPDVLELLRAQASQIYSYNFHALEVLKSLPSGYNRDSRDTKGPIMNGLARIRGSLEQSADTIAGLEFHAEKMLTAAEENYSMAPDLAEFLAQKYQIPFRVMHEIVGRSVAQAIEEGKAIKEITAYELKEAAQAIGYQITFKKSDIDQGTNVAKSIERRDNIGGAAPDEMKKWLKKRKKRVSKNWAWIAKKEQKINRANELLRESGDGSNS